MVDIEYEITYEEDTKTWGIRLYNMPDAYFNILLFLIGKVFDFLNEKKLMQIKDKGDR